MLKIFNNWWHLLILLLHLWAVLEAIITNLWSNFTDNDWHIFFEPVQLGKRLLNWDEKLFWLGVWLEECLIQCDNKALSVLGWFFICDLRRCFWNVFWLGLLLCQTDLRQIGFLRAQFYVYVNFTILAHLEILSPIKRLLNLKRSNFDNVTHFEVFVVSEVDRGHSFVLPTRHNHVFVQFVDRQWALVLNDVGTSLWGATTRAF